MGRTTRSMIALGAAAGSLLAATTAFAAEIAVSKAWVPPSEAVGSDVVLSMTIRNDGAEPDALVRAACPFANFSEKRTVDRGEGAPAARAIPNIPLPAGATVTLAATGYHVALLQIREALTDGAEFDCSLTFRKAGPVPVKVRVARSAPG
jgi:periplasmic copper chaperone A